MTVISWINITHNHIFFQTVIGKEQKLNTILKLMNFFYDSRSNVQEISRSEGVSHGGSRLVDLHWLREQITLQTLLCCHLGQTFGLSCSPRIDEPAYYLMSQQYEKDYFTNHYSVILKHVYRYPDTGFQ